MIDKVDSLVSSYFLSDMRIEHETSVTCDSVPFSGLYGMPVW